MPDEVAGPDHFNSFSSNLSETLSKINLTFLSMLFE